MKIIVAGDGKMGSTLTRQLALEGHDLTLIDANSRVLESTQERYDVMVIQGNCATWMCCSRRGLRRRICSLP